jgi:hypothetical protein
MQIRLHLWGAGQAFNWWYSVRAASDGSCVKECFSLTSASPQHTTSGPVCNTQSWKSSKHKSMAMNNYECRLSLGNQGKKHYRVISLMTSPNKNTWASEDECCLLIMAEVAAHITLHFPIDIALKPGHLVIWEVSRESQHLPAITPSPPPAPCKVCVGVKLDLEVVNSP